MEKRKKGDGRNFRNKYLFYFLWVLYKMDNIVISNLACQPVECENANCHTNASNVRYWSDEYFRKCNDWVIEVKKGEMKDRTIWNLNREVEKLLNDLKAVRAVFSEFYEPRLQALQKVKDNLDKYVIPVSPENVRPN